MATKKGAGAKKQASPLDPKVADRLLDLLSTDNDFRRLFKKDPQAALVKAGWMPPKAETPGVSKVRKGPPKLLPPGTCYAVTSIAPKQEIAAARDRLQAYLTSSLAPTNPHCFEAGRVSRTLKRTNF